MPKRTTHYGRYVGEAVELPKPHSGIYRVVALALLDNNRCYVVPEEKYVKGQTTDAYKAGDVSWTVAEWCRTVAKSPA